MSYTEKKNRSMFLSDMQIVLEAMERIDKSLSGITVTDASFTVSRDDAEELAEIWWDSESEEWLCDWHHPITDMDGAVIIHRVEVTE